MSANRSSRVSPSGAWPDVVAACADAFGGVVGRLIRAIGFASVQYFFWQAEVPSRERFYPNTFAKTRARLILFFRRVIINSYPRGRQAKIVRAKSSRTCISLSVALALGICFPLTMETNFNRAKKIRAALPEAADAGNAAATPFAQASAPPPGAKP
jgi:hypothetical protein